LRKIRGETSFQSANDRGAPGIIEIASSSWLAWGGGVVHSRRAKFLRAVHILLTFTAIRPASGLRLETATKIDKEKSEFYFLSRIKKILTEN
jgi:hypothetical protein